MTWRRFSGDMPLGWRPRAHPAAAAPWNPLVRAPTSASPATILIILTSGLILLNLFEPKKETQLNFITSGVC